MRVSKKQSEFIDEVIKERERQLLLWGKQVLDMNRLLTVIVEEVGEVARVIHDLEFTNDADVNNLKEELVQVAACCLKFYEQI